MKYCPYCGADLLDDASAFCTECGKTLPSQSEAEEVPAPKEKVKKRKASKKKPRKKPAPILSFLNRNRRKSRMMDMTGITMISCLQITVTPGRHWIKP